MSVAINLAGIHAMGFLPTAPNSVGSTSVNAAANWYAVSFTTHTAKTLSKVRVYISALVGTLGGSDVTADLYDNSGASGAPGSSIETGKVPTATITAAGWYEFTGFSTALTANDTYWIVFKNVHGTPASNYCTFRNVGSLTGGWIGGSAQLPQAWGTASSTNSGSTWSRDQNRFHHRIEYSDGSFAGIPVSNAAIAAVGDGVYSTRESGMKFTAPSNATLKVAGLAVYIGGKISSPTGNMRLGLWTGSTPANLAYTEAIPITALSASWVMGFFSSVQSLSPGTITRVTLGETTQSDTSSNRYGMQEITWDTDANSQILLPWNGTAQKTYYDGSSWTDTALGTSVFGHALLLDTAGEFAAGASGGAYCF